MKLAENVVEIDQSDDLQSAGFGFEFNAKMADMLSNKIYSDPILAVVREYICNAVDAHSNLPIARAIDISVPSFIDPTWSVRDYGSGLSQEQIMGTAPNFRGLFNTYGRSDKSNSNSSIGGFGLGSKAGFAYVKQDGAFTVTSWHGGRKKVYTCHRNTKGLPAVTLMSDTVSDEPSGIKIAIPVSNDNFNAFNAFKDRTKIVIRHMTQEFSVYGTTEVLKEKIEYEYTGSNWGLRKGYSNGPVIIMGGIAYPIDNNQFSGDTHRVLRNSFDITAPIGSVELSVSREALSYEGSTIPFIIQACDTIKNELSKVLLSSIETASSIIEASRAYHKLAKSNFGWFVQSSTVPSTWKGKKLLYQVPKYSCAYNTGSKVAGYTLDSQINLESNKATTTKFYSLNLHKNVGYDYLTIKDRSWSNGWSVYLSEEYKFIYDDCGGRYKSHLAGLLKKIKDGAAANNSNTVEKIILIKGCSWSRFLKIYVRAGRHNTYCKLSSIPEYSEPKVPSGYKPPKDSKRDINYLVPSSYGYSKAANFRGINVDFADTTKEYYYLPTKAYNFYGKFSDTELLNCSHSVMEDFDFQSILGLSSKPIIYLVPFTYKNLVLSNAKWINVADKVREYLDTIKKDKKFIDTKYLHSSWVSSSYTPGSLPLDLVRAINGFYARRPEIKDTFWKDLNTKAEKVLEFSDDKFTHKMSMVDSAFRFFSTSWQNEIAPTAHIPTLPSLTKTEIERYVPLLAHLDLVDLVGRGSKEALDMLSQLVLKIDNDINTRYTGLNKKKTRNGDED